MGNGLRVLVPARKSRKVKDDTEASRYARQESLLTERAERDGHVVIDVVRDTVSSQTMPWERKNLKAWFTDPSKLQLWDALFIETDRLSRGTDQQWHDIEDFCYRNDKKILTAEGVMFPPRDDSDRYQWIGLKRRARTYWEDVRAKHAGTREVIRANGGAIGLAPFGYAITGEKLHKTFVIDPVSGPLAREAFRRIADGATASSVAVWLSEATDKPWRIKRVTDMIRRRTYLGERDGFTFEPLVTEDQWSAANNALNTRSFTQKVGGRAVAHMYSGLIYCECGMTLYRHKADRGSEKYRCSRGRSGLLTEKKCEFPSWMFDKTNEAIDRLMAKVFVPERITATIGGDFGKNQALAEIKDDMAKAMAAGKMDDVTKLAAMFSEIEGREAEEVRTVLRETGKSYAQVWESGSLEDRREMLKRGDFKVTVKGSRVNLTWVSKIDQSEALLRWERMDASEIL